MTESCGDIGVDKSDPQREEKVCYNVRGEDGVWRCSQCFPSSPSEPPAAGGEDLEAVEPICPHGFGPSERCHTCGPIGAGSSDGRNHPNVPQIKVTPTDRATAATWLGNVYKPQYAAALRERDEALAKLKEQAH